MKTIKISKFITLGAKLFYFLLLLIFCSCIIPVIVGWISESFFYILGFITLGITLLGLPLLFIWCILTFIFNINIEFLEE